VDRQIQIVTIEARRVDQQVAVNLQHEQPLEMDQVQTVETKREVCVPTIEYHERQVPDITTHVIEREVHVPKVLRVERPEFVPQVQNVHLRREELVPVVKEVHRAIPKYDITYHEKEIKVGPRYMHMSEDIEEEFESGPVTYGAPQAGYSSSQAVTYGSQQVTEYASRGFVEPVAGGQIGMSGQAVTYGAPAASTAYTSSYTQQGISGGQAYGMGNQALTLEISILHATGLKDMNWSADSMWVQCQSVRDHNSAHKHDKVQHIQTKQITGTKDPVDNKALDVTWNETHQLGGWFVGETLEFVMYDKGLISSKTEGKAHISSDDFYPNGFEGMISIEGLPNAALAVRIVPLQ